MFSLLSSYKQYKYFIIMVVVTLLAIGTVFTLSNRKNQYKNRARAAEIAEPYASQGQKSEFTIPDQISPTAAQPNEASRSVYLILNEPANNTIVSASFLRVSGTTVPFADVSVNEKDLKADGAGKFFTALTLEEGENIILIVANDQDGNYSEKEFTVTYQSSP